MRVWTLHPKYLDRQGLLALWRETLLAQKVLQGQTKGYRNHPQLTRFRACADPLAAIGAYLLAVANEADSRGYRFESGKIASTALCEPLEETDGQLLYEWGHLKNKLELRSPEMYKRIRSIEAPQPHPLFVIVKGEVREWEKV